MRGIVIVLALAGCCREPWAAFPRPTMPDRSCTTGSSVQGTDVYVWECVDGHKIVVTQYSAEMSCQAPQEEVLECGAAAAIEADPTIQCAGARSGREWIP